MFGVKGSTSFGAMSAAVRGAIVSWCLLSTAQAQSPCDDALFVHNYPVHDAGAYAALFGAVEGYVAGPAARRAWPFAEEGAREYPTRDYCPVDPDDRLVRLFEAEPGEIETASMQAGTLTLVARDLAEAEQAAAGVAVEGPRESEFEGRRSIYFVDAAGNEFFVWEFPGPPGSE